MKDETPMDFDAKISPAFEEFLEHNGMDEKREAIVIYRPTEIDQGRARGRLRTLRQRLNYVKERAAAQAPIQKKLLANYKREGSRLTPGKGKFAASPIGANTLPVATVQVTRRTLPQLAHQEEVLAVLPNQRLHLIQPKQVDFVELNKQESKDHLTWGLKQLGISELWKKAKTRGHDVNVAVLDTGVYAEHSALRGRLKISSS